MHLSGYTIHRKVAEGGMGEIFLASRSGIHGFAREVAIKRVSPHLAREEAYVQMFLQEARIAALLDHPNVVQIHELVEQNGEYFLVMEYVDGPSLSRCLEAAAGPVPFEVAAQIAAQVAAGLWFVHEKQDGQGRPLKLVHRDVSPPNILLSTQGAVKLTDFGIAKLRVRGVLSEAGVIKGKYSYLAPEQVRGDPVDHRADIYSLGLVLYEMTVGRRAYHGEDADVLSAVAAGCFTPPEQVRPDYPEDLRAVVMRALSLVPEDRYPSCKELERDLVGILIRRGVAPSPYLVGQFVRAQVQTEEPLLEEASPPPLPFSLPTGTDSVRLRHGAHPLLRYRVLLLLLYKLDQLRRVARLHRRQIVLGTTALVLLLISVLIFVWIGQMSPVDPQRATASADPQREAAPADPQRAAAPAAPAVAVEREQVIEPGPAGDDAIGPVPSALRKLPPPRRHRPAASPGRAAGTRPAASPGRAAGTRSDASQGRAAGTLSDASTRRVALISEPPCEVFIGRRRLGQTPLRALLPRRRVVLSFVNSELGLRARRPVEPDAARLHLRFKKGKIALRLKPGLYVQVDGKMVGRTPLPPVPVYEGRHAVRVIDPFRYDRRSYQVLVREGATAVVP